MALLAVAVVACGVEKNNNAAEPAPVGDDSTTRSDEPTTSRETFAPSSHHQGSDEGDQTLIPELPANEQIDPGGAACTPDLRSVVDGAGRLIQECPNDQGCAAGECVAACDAAARSSGSMGCEFWAPTPPLEAHLTMCHAVFLANTWNRPAKLRLTYAGEEFDIASFAQIPRGSGADVEYQPLPDGQLPANEVAVVFLSHPGGNGTPDCPIPAAVAGRTFI